MKKKLIFLMVFTILSVNCIQVLAADNGDGKAVGLTLVESNPGNGAVDVSLDTQIKLIFNKNVVNLTVKDNNSKCFKLLEANNEVPIEVIFPDDQMEPDRKREITLKPLELLKENTTYKVEVSEKLQAKNGTSLGTTISFTFDTVVLEPPVQKLEAAPAASKETTAVGTVESQAVEAVTEVSDKSDTAEAAESTQTAEAPEAAEATETIETPETAEATETIEAPEAVVVQESVPVEADTGKAAVQYLWIVIIITVAIAAIILALKKRKL